MLALIFTHRNLFCLIEQNVARLQNRVGEQPHRGSVRALFRRLVFELRHAAGLAETGDAVQHPGEFGVRRHLRLNEEGRFGRVDTGRDVLGDGASGVLA